METWVAELLNKILGLLPLSPFANVIENMSTDEFQLGISYLNWFIDVEFILSVTALWLGAITLFYAYSVIMRWVKVIGG